MLRPSIFFRDLTALGFRDFCGVPDSLLMKLTAYIEEQSTRGVCRFDITANEGAAVALAIGRYLASGVPAVVFMQNSGLGNAVNPLTSLASSKVYGIPMLLLIGWRGEITEEGQLHDEPQHVFQGEVTLSLLSVLNIPHVVVGPDSSEQYVHDALKSLRAESLRETKPVALVFRRNVFSAIKDTSKPAVSPYPTREAAISKAMTCLKGVPIVATTGMISRELYELRKEQSADNPYFLTIGGMGHASMIATGLARQDPSRKVACFDGDGAVLMHTGSLANSARCGNLLHLIFNNQSHDSVGGHRTAGAQVRLTDLAISFGYPMAERVTELNQLGITLAAARRTENACFIEVMVARGARADLGRPKETPAASKNYFMTVIGEKNE